MSAVFSIDKFGESKDRLEIIVRFIIGYWSRECKVADVNPVTTSLIQSFIYGDSIKYIGDALKYFKLSSATKFSSIKGIKYYTTGSEDDSDYRRETEECVILFVEDFKCYYKYKSIYYSRGGQSGGTTEAEGYWSIMDDGKLILTMKRKDTPKKEEIIKKYTFEQLQKISAGYNI